MRAPAIVAVLSLRKADEPAVAGEDQVLRIGRAVAENALVHTPAGTPIEVSVTPGVRFEVRDHGPGLPPD